ncbi:hypothetical protein D3C85_1263760 [compost metagenome]
MREQLGVILATHTGYRKVLDVGIEQLRMGTIAVVALAVVLEDQLPVTPLDQVGLERHLAIIQVVRADEGGNRIAERFEIRRLVGHANVDVAVHHFAMSRLEAIVGNVEIRPHVTGEEQFAVQVENPFVVGADQLGDFSAVFAANLGAPVPAGIVERPHLAVAATHHRNRVVANLQCQVLAGLLEFEGMSGKDPFLVPDLFKILAIHFRVTVSSARKGMTLFALANQG